MCILHTYYIIEETTPSLMRTPANIIGKVSYSIKTNAVTTQRIWIA